MVEPSGWVVWLFSCLHLFLHTNCMWLPTEKQNSSFHLAMSKCFPIVIVFFTWQWSFWLQLTTNAWTDTQKSSFVFQRKKQFIQGCNSMTVNKWWHNFHFGVNYPFNASKTEEIMIVVQKKTHQIVPAGWTLKYWNLINVYIYLSNKLDCCDHMIYLEPYAFAESTEMVWCVPDF